MNQQRVAEAVEAAARALHESVREQQQFKWETMTETWREEMRKYVRPSVIAALEASDEFVARTAMPPASATRPRINAVER